MWYVLAGTVRGQEAGRQRAALLLVLATIIRLRLF